MDRYTMPTGLRITGADLHDLNRDSLRIPDFDNAFHMLNLEGPMFWRVSDAIARGEDRNQVIYWWREDDINARAATVSSSASASATTVSVDDAKVFIANKPAYCTRTKEQLFVTGTDNSANTITVSRGWPNGTYSAALVEGDKLVPGMAHLPEYGTANLANTELPTGKQFNYCSIFSESVRCSDRQDRAEMMEIDGEQVATMPYLVKLQTRKTYIALNNDLLYSKRGIYTSHADGEIPVMGGFYDFLSGNILDLDDQRGTMTWPIFSDYVDRTADPTASSDEKALFCGNLLYSNIRKICREAGVDVKTYINPDFGATGANSMELLTEQGRKLVIFRDKYGFSSETGKAGDGIVVDMGNIELVGYKDTPVMWRPDIQPKNAHYYEDEIWGSISLKVMHPSTHGAIHSAPRQVIPAVRY